eukprot:Plantae.Rhodophyta-Purpureofilum_apyrenoidigerum.ctg21228.p1 GENE.Plantae.Rhodophyta-Purpureofilum_apyrenoidigerum.ctg21228~~Plantae.Rhodophyta-Purpureofilum_apyrenoidigerum.ctg21228.p1  ORF type:complete len:250 (-),score=10.03 Plantae.Rhodophyta-Purpureofilum_apyrenoidigerum.ctg21228:169-918(-)
MTCMSRDAIKRPGSVGFVAGGFEMRRPRGSAQTQVETRSSRHRKAVVATIPGVEWALFFILVNKFGDGSGLNSQVSRFSFFRRDTIATEVPDKLKPNIDAIPCGTERSPCKCDSGKMYSECCLSYHAGKTYPRTPTALIRARFSAYANNLPEFVLLTTSAQSKDWVDPDKSVEWTRWREQVSEFCRDFEPVKCQILEEKIFRKSGRATVLFRAEFSKAGQPVNFVEKSDLVWTDVGFTYVDGRLFDIME